MITKTIHTHIVQIDKVNRSFSCAFPTGENIHAILVYLAQPE